MLDLGSVDRYNPFVHFAAVKTIFIKQREIVRDRIIVEIIPNLPKNTQPQFCYGLLINLNIRKAGLSLL